MRFYFLIQLNLHTIGTETNTNSISNIGTAIVCLPVQDSTGKENEGMKEFSSSTESSVQKETTIVNECNSHNVRVESCDRTKYTCVNDNNPSQDLSYRSESMEDIEKSELDSIIDMAEDVEFIDSFDFNSTEVDKLEEHVGIDELN